MESDANAAYCMDAVRRGDHDRYLAALFAPDRARPSLLALYAFSLELARVRDSVSEPILGQMRLQWWREAVGAIYAGEGPPHHAVAMALAAAIRERELPREELDVLIDARERDLDDDPPADLAALEAYADATAGTLVRLALRLLDAADAEAQAAGRHAGIAWGLTGLLRAIPHHARARRLFLPAAVLAKSRGDAEAVFAGRATDGVRDAVAAVADAARGHLDAARSRRGAVPRRARAAVLPSTLADRYLDRLARAGHDPFGAPTAMSPLARQAALAWTALRGRF